MARTPKADVARDRRISVRVTEGEEDSLNRQRGRQSQSDYVRRLIAEDGRRQSLRRQRATRAEGV